ncbi:flagellar hook-length control protein FliK [Psychrobacillus psychrotolerans]|uniref:Flagellar hook-length control protein FliK n=1 Tax=Psychrobacillus psychrotolerans TaxID=126156 RepID=A0A1I5WE44_9BACI|nr:flagellar hook-length control protein FliK [Psychrobacillus psychrotolerans]SFQ18012.1 flagellar hook-length control protein FliK [Psychrobacillus psychrotolerans]
MNIAMPTGTNVNAAIQTSSKIQTTMNNSQKFGSVFGQILSNSQVQPIVTEQVNPVGNVLQDLLAILNATSIEELESVLGTEDLTVNPKELKGLLDKLLGTDSDVNMNEEIQQSNVWDLLAGINEQATKLTDAIISSLNGQGPSTPTDAKQAIEFLKTVQLIGNKSDLTIKEESTLFDMKQLLENVKEAVSKLPTSETFSSSQLLKQPIIHTQMVVKQTAHTLQTEVVTETKEITSNVQGSTTTVIQTKVESVSLTLPTEKAGQSEEFIKELQKVMNRVQFGQTGGVNRLVLKLFPEHLGTIRIELIQKDGMLTARILASTALGKEMLDSNSSQLRQGFAGQNIQLEKLEISQALQDSVRQEKQQNFQQSFKQQQQEQSNEETNTESQETPISFDDFLTDMEV